MRDLHLSPLTFVACILLGHMVLTHSRLQAQSPQDPLLITGGREVAQATERLQSIYGKVITYEDPILELSTDLAPTGTNETGRFALAPTPLSFKMPVEVGREPDLRSILEKTLNAYDQQTDGPHFQILASKIGLHVVPGSIRDKDGKTSTPRNPLDEYIAVPQQERTTTEHFQALIQAVATQTGFMAEFYFPYSARGATSLESFFGGPGRYVWGTNRLTLAREAIIDLLDHSETSLSWEFRCNQTPGVRDAHCGFTLSPVVMELTQSDGSKSKKVLSHDRAAAAH